MQDLRDQAGTHGHFSANSHRYDSERNALSSAMSAHPLSLFDSYPT